MDNEVHSQLVMALLEAPGMNDYTVRTSLLVNIPNSHSLTRSQDPQADISFIISQLSAMHFSNGSWGLLIFIDRVLSRVSGTTLSDRLLEIRRLFEAALVAKDNGQSGTQLPHSEEVHEETEKKENASDDAHSIALQQAQEFQSEVMEVQQSLLKVQEPLKIVCKLFREVRGIRQDQCDKAILNISNLNTPILKIRELYNKAPHFLGAFPIPSYQAKVILNDIDDQIDEINSSLLRFRDNCPVSWMIVQSYQSYNENEKIESDRKEISEQIDSLLEMLKEMNTLLHKFLRDLSAP